METGFVVFSDDWGRHPSSCQHLIQRLLPQHPVLWVNTIGTRMPSLSAEDLGKILAKLRAWRQAKPAPAAHAHLQIISPRMWPGFRTGWQRRLNAHLISTAITRALAESTAMPARRIAITTLPITADLVGRLPVERWVYYAVDDFSVWPGADSAVMDRMERELVAQVDTVIAVSPTLNSRIKSMGKDSSLLTHGIDLQHWMTDTNQSLISSKISTCAQNKYSPKWGEGLQRPIVLFWGLVDKRLDTEWCQAILTHIPGTLVLVGPQQDPDPRLLALTAPAPSPAAVARQGRLLLPGAMDYADLPNLAQWADLLVMPYADLPVTRAMQPLKFKEYLAAGYPGSAKPVVARDLPAVREWADAADLATTASQAVALIQERLAGGVPASQMQARQRLNAESWSTKAQIFARMVLSGI